MARMAEASLHELLDALDLQGIRILTPDADLDVGVRAVVIADAQQLASVPAGAFVLIPGAPRDRAALEQAIRVAAAAGAVGVSIRDTSWASAASDAEAVPDVAVPVVGIPDRLPWGDLYEMLSTLLAAAGGLAARHPSDRPMADLFAFADAVAGALGGAVTIEDHQARLLAYSSLPEQEIDSAREDTILQRRVPLTDGFRAQYVQLTRTTEALPFSLGDQTDPGTPSRMAIAIRAGDQILGFLWVIGDRTTLAPDITTQLAHAARMAAVHLMRARAVGDVARHAQDDALIRLLEGPHDKRLLGAVGLRRCRSAVVLAAKPVSDTFDGADDPGAGWLGGLVAVIARSRHPGAQCVSVDGVAYVVVGSSSERPPDLAELARTIVDRSAGHSRQLHIGIATTDTIEQLDRARRDADVVLAALAERGDAPAVATLEEVRGLPVLVALKRLVADCPQLLSGPIRAMLAPDRRAPAWCVETLRAYLACFGNQPATAKALGIHPNTLRYRLNRVTELFDLRLDDPDERLVLALQLRLLAPPRSGD
jgi:hypothetical protein